MKKSRFSEEQIAFALRQAETGSSIVEGTESGTSAKGRLARIVGGPVYRGQVTAQTIKRGVHNAPVESFWGKLKTEMVRLH